MLPAITMAGESHNIYGVTIHLKNNKSLRGYIETGFSLYKCNEKEDVSDEYKLTAKSFLERLREQYDPGGKDKVTITFIYKLYEAKYIQFDKLKHEYHTEYIPVAAKSSVKKIKVIDIKSIENACRKWDGYCFDNYTGIPSVTDRMAEIMSTNKFIASYVYTDEEVAKDKVKPCDLCGGATTFLSYNPKYTRDKLRKIRKKLYKMSDEKLEEEGLVKYFEAWD